MDKWIEDVNQKDFLFLFYLKAEDKDIPEIDLIFSSKFFVKIDYDLWTDDQFAVDQYQAKKGNVDITEYLNKKKHEKG